MANSTPIHQAIANGAHEVEPPGTRPACLRCQRESHSRRVPSGSRNTSLVTKGPKPRLPSRCHPCGTSTLATATAGSR